MQAWQMYKMPPDSLSGVEGMHYGTVMYRKHLWTNQARFCDSPKGDDGSSFVRKLINLGARVHTLPCDEHQVYIRHGRNIWQYRPGEKVLAASYGIRLGLISASLSATSAFIN